MSKEISKRYSGRGVSAGKEDVHNAIKNVDTFTKHFDKTYKTMFRHVELWQRRDKKQSKLMGESTFELGDERPYIFAGCVPQIIDYHDLNSKKLIPVGDYGKRQVIDKSDEPVDCISANGIKLDGLYFVIFISVKYDDVTAVL